MKKQLTNSEKKQFEYLIRVIHSAINSSAVPLPYNEISWNDMLKTVNKCGFDSLFANTLLNLDDLGKVPSEVVTKLNEISAQQLMIDTVLDYEIEKLLRTFEKFKIKNAMLKGYFMKMEYPRSDFRSVSDYDILFDRSQINEVKTAFAELEYDFEHNDDSQYYFVKKPYMYIEMHYSLVHRGNRYYDLLSNQLDKTTRREDYEYSYEMNIEDYYLYMLIHHSNHFRVGGMGIRMLLDIYIYNKNHRRDFNSDYLKKMLKLYKLETFERKMLEIAQNWFATEKPEIIFDDIESYILLSGTIGTIDTTVMVNSQKSISNADGKQKPKLFYIFSSVFPPRKAYEFSYPTAYKYPVLLPFAWACLWFNRFFIKKNVHIKRGIKNRMSYTDEDVSYISSVLNKAGFDLFND